MTALCTAPETRMNAGAERRRCAGCVRQTLKGFDSQPKSVFTGKLALIGFVLGRAPGSGPGGRRFKSSLPDQSFQ